MNTREQAIHCSRKYPLPPSYREYLPTLDLIMVLEPILSGTQSNEI